MDSKNGDSVDITNVFKFNHTLAKGGYLPVKKSINKTE